MTEHICPKNAWPTGHPLPPVDPAKLTGPEAGSMVTYHNHFTRQDQPAEVLERSYVWSPGECWHNGGYRRYDWTVIKTFDGAWYTVVVNDSDLVWNTPAIDSRDGGRNER